MASVAATLQAAYQGLRDDAAIPDSVSFEALSRLVGFPEK
jgi:hypothetical protein